MLDWSRGVRFITVFSRDRAVKYFRNFSWIGIYMSTDSRTLRWYSQFRKLILSHLCPLECLLPIQQVFAVDFRLGCSEFIQEVSVIDKTGLEKVCLWGLARDCKHGVTTLSDCQSMLKRHQGFRLTHVLALMVSQLLAAIRRSRDQSVCPRSDCHLILVHDQIQRSISTGDLAARYTVAGKLDHVRQCCSQSKFGVPGRTKA